MQQTGLFSNKAKAYMAIMLAHTFIAGTNAKFSKDYGIDLKQAQDRIYFASQRISKKLPRTAYRNLEKHIINSLEKFNVTPFTPAEMIALTLNFIAFIELIVTDEMDSIAAQLISEVKHILLSKTNNILTAEMITITEAEADTYFRVLLDAI